MPGVPWQPGSEPCGGSGGGGGTPWKGVQCSAEGQVVALQLPGLGLAGTLPPGLLAALPALQRLDLSGNALTAGLPAGWAGAALVSLNLSGNGGLTGGLPPAWGAALPALTELRLQGNNLTGGCCVEACGGRACWGPQPGLGHRRRSSGCTCVHRLLPIHTAGGINAPH